MLLFTTHMEYCGYANCLHISMIEKKVRKGRIKELPWRNRRIVFGTMVLQIRLRNLIFRVLHLAQWQAGWL